MKQTKEIANKTSSDLDLKMDDDLIGLMPRAEASDFEIPRLVLYQPTSKIEGAFTPGDIVDGQTGLKVSGAADKLQFVPIWFFKDFVVSEADTKKFRRNEPKTQDNAMRSIFDNRIGVDPDGVAVEWKERLNLFIIPFDSLQDDFPRMYRMIIKSSSMKESKKLLSEWDIQLRSRLAPFSFVWEVSTKMLVTSQSKYAVYLFNKVLENGKQKRVDSQGFEKVKFWVKTLKTNKDKVEKVDAPEIEDHSDQAIPF